MKSTTSLRAPGKAFRLRAAPLPSRYRAMIIVCTLLSIVCIRPDQGHGTEWQAVLEVSNGASVVDSIIFGVHPDATDGVDMMLGEVGLPPWPPSSLFEVRFVVPDCEGLKLDLRDTTHTQRFHTIKWQAGSGGYPVTVRWDRESLPYASLFISDGYGGVFIPPVNMYHVDSLEVPASMSYITQLTLDVTPGVSPGAEPEIGEIPDAAVYRGQQFPEYALDEYVFDPDTPDSLLSWYVTGNAALICEIDEDRMLIVHAPEGWTGSETVMLTARDVEYHTDQAMVTYSVLVGGLPAWTVPLTVENGAQESRSVRFGINPVATEGIDTDLGEVELPPWPPQDAFDARFELPDGFTYSMRDIRFCETGWISFHLVWQAGAGGYPITVQWSSDLPLGDFYICDDMGHMIIPCIDMSTVDELVIAPEDSVVTGLEIVIDAVVDTMPPVGPRFLQYVSSVSGFSVDLEWDECDEENFAYYEILYDTAYFESHASFVCDWTEDATLAEKGTTSTTVFILGPAGEYSFRIRAWDTFGNVGELSNRVVVGIDGDYPEFSPTDLTLHIWPNPLHGSATIIYSIPRNSRAAMITIYDVTGKRIRHYRIGSSKSNAGSFVWDGRDKRGHEVSPGVYFCHLETTKSSTVKKVLVIR